MPLPKVIILAAGEGTRLRPLTDDRPKCMVHYQGRPLIDWTLDTLAQVGLREVIIVGGYRADDLASRATRMYLNCRFGTTNMVESLFCAEEELEGDVIISYGDIAYRRDVAEKLLASSAPFSVVVDRKWRDLWTQRMTDPLVDAESLIMNPDGNIRELGEKPVSEADIQGQYIGLLKISGSAMQRVRAFYHSLDRNGIYRSRPFAQMYMTTFIQLIIDNLMPVHGVMIDGGWIEIDSPGDLQCTMC